ECPGRSGLITFGGGPEEGPILHNRSTDGSAVQPVLEIRLYCIEEIPRSPFLGAVLEVARTMPVVGSGFHRCVENTAARSPQFPVVGIELDLDFGNRFNVWKEHGAVSKVGDRNAIHEVVIPANGPAGQRRSCGIRLILLSYVERIAGVNRSWHAQG